MTVTINNFSSGQIVNRLKMTEMETSTSNHSHGEPNVPNLYSAKWISTIPNSPGNCAMTLTTVDTITSNPVIFSLANSGSSKFTLELSGNVTSTSILRATRYFPALGGQTVPKQLASTNLIMDVEANSGVYLPFDRLAEYSFVSDIGSLKESGNYYFSAHVAFGVSSVQVYFAIMVNSSILAECRMGCTPQGNGDMLLRSSAIKQCTAGDTIRIVANTDQTGGTVLSDATLHVMRLR